MIEKSFIVKIIMIEISFVVNDSIDEKSLIVKSSIIEISIIFKYSRVERSYVVEGSKDKRNFITEYSEIIIFSSTCYCCVYEDIFPSNIRADGDYGSIFFCNPKGLSLFFRQLRSICNLWITKFPETNATYTSLLIVWCIRVEYTTFNAERNRIVFLFLRECFPCF